VARREILVRVGLAGWRSSFHKSANASETGIIHSSETGEVWWSLPITLVGAFDELLETHRSYPAILPGLDANFTLGMNSPWLEDIVSFET
jgi:hypothetical protein